MNISVFGLGYVGCVTLGCLAKRDHMVIGVDKNSAKVDQINAGKATIIEQDLGEIIAEGQTRGCISATLESCFAVTNSDLSIVAVGTPSTEHGHLNLQYVFNVAENIGKALIQKDTFHIIVIRSTILPGTCNKIADIIQKTSGKERNVDFAVVDNPEFLREGSAVKDFQNPDRIVIGSSSEKAKELMENIYSSIARTGRPIINTDIKSVLLFE